MINAAAFNSAMNIVEEFNNSNFNVPLDTKGLVTNIIFDEIAKAVDQEYTEYVAGFK